MKKVFKLSIFMILIILFVIIIQTNKSKIIYKECNNNEVKLKYITYKFTGKSDHFGFETGNVDLDKNNYEILLTNFKQTKKINNIDNFKITIYFNDKEWANKQWNKSKDISFKKFLKNIIFYEEDIEYTEENSPDFKRSSDAFVETIPDDFKKSIKAVIKYCYKDTCKTENLKFEFLENEKK